MPKMFRKVTIEKLTFPLDNVYYYNAMLWLSSDNINYYHCGFGKYCKTLEEAESYKKEQEVLE